MTRMIAVAACALLSFPPSICAQIYLPAPGGIGIQYNGGRLKVSGYYAPGLVVPVSPGGVILGPPGYLVSPYSVERRVIAQQIVPPLISRVALPPEPDVTGIDLDLESPDKLYPPGTAPTKKPVVKPIEPKADLPKKPPEELLKPPAAVPEGPPPPMKPPVEDLLTPRAGVADESRRLVELGVLAFQQRAYGLAVMRFEQASAVDPANARAFFLLAQSYLAVGQFRDAVKAIHAGLDLRPDWPVAKFSPRTELYAGALEDWLEHRRRLVDAVKWRPKDGGYLFLRAYIEWFDGERPQAVELFHNARPLVADPQWIDLFLKHAPAVPLAKGP